MRESEQSLCPRIESGHRTGRLGERDDGADRASNRAGAGDLPAPRRQREYAARSRAGVSPRKSAGLYALDEPLGLDAASPEAGGDPEIGGRVVAQGAAVARGPPAAAARGRRLAR